MSTAGSIAAAIRADVERSIQKLQRENSKLMRLLLESIHDRAQRYEQQVQLKEGFSGPYENEQRLEALVELLEIFDCGSVGGFSKGQPEMRSVFDRARWLLKKYKYKKDETP